MANHPKYDLKKTKNGQYQFNLTASNGHVILSSETYTSKSGATNGIESVKKNSADEDRYEKKTAKNGEFYFNLIATNGQVIGSSEMYSSESGRDQGIGSVMVSGGVAEMEDNT